MPGMFSAKIKPSEFQKIQKKFQRLVERTQNRVVTAAVRESLKPVLSDARSKAPKGKTGMLGKATKLKVKGYRKNGIVVGIIGVSRMSKEIDGKIVNPAKYAHMVEYGTKAHGPKKKQVMSNGKIIFGKKVKGTTARPFIRPTWDRNKGSMERNVRSKIGRGIQSLVKGI